MILYFQTFLVCCGAVAFALLSTGCFSSRTLHQSEYREYQSDEIEISLNNTSDVVILQRWEADSLGNIKGEGYRYPNWNMTNVPLSEKNDRYLFEGTIRAANIVTVKAKFLETGIIVAGAVIGGLFVLYVIAPSERWFDFK